MKSLSLYSNASYNLIGCQCWYGWCMNEGSCISLCRGQDEEKRNLGTADEKPVCLFFRSSAAPKRPRHHSTCRCIRKGSLFIMILDSIKEFTP